MLSIEEDRASAHTERTKERHDGLEADGARVGDVERRFVCHHRVGLGVLEEGDGVGGPRRPRPVDGAGAAEPSMRSRDVFMAAIRIA